MGEFVSLCVHVCMCYFNRILHEIGRKAQGYLGAGHWRGCKGPEVGMGLSRNNKEAGLIEADFSRTKAL